MDSRPVGLRKVSSTLASPDIFQPISWTQRWCWSQSSTRLHRSVGPLSTQCTTWCTSVNSVCVQPGNRHPLSRRRISIRWASLGSRRVRPRLRLCPRRAVGRDQDLGVTGQPSGDLAGDRPQHVELGAPIAPGEEAVRSAWTTTVGRLRRRPPALASAGASPLGPAASPLHTRDQSVGHPLVERRAIPVAATGPGDERALHDRVLLLGEHAGQAAPAIVEAEEAPGVEAGGSLVGLVPSGDGQLPHLLGRPAGRLLGQRGVRLGPGHLDEGLHLVEGELALRERIGDLGQRLELGRRRDPLPGRRGGHAAALDEPGDHGRRAVDAPGLAAVELHDGRQQLALVGRDRPVMLRHAGHQALGSPRHGVGPGSVSEG